MKRGQSVGTWILYLLVAIALLAFAQGTDFSGQPVLWAAASLLTIPMGIASALASTTVGTIILPFFFIALVYYLHALRVFLSNEVIYFILFAAGLVVLAKV